MSCPGDSWAPVSCQLFFLGLTDQSTAQILAVLTSPKLLKAFRTGNGAHLPISEGYTKKKLKYFSHLTVLST